jgi:formylglycine-generating enzyme required for sulfatase activity
MFTSNVWEWVSDWYGATHHHRQPTRKAFLAAQGQLIAAALGTTARKIVGLPAMTGEDLTSVTPTSACAWSQV